MTRDTEDLRRLLGRIALRLAAVAASRVLARCAAVGGAGLLGWALLTAVVPVPFPLPAAAAVIGGVLAVAVPVLLRCLRPRPLFAARVADHRLRLADRLSTAVELLTRPASPAGPRPAGLTGLARLQVADALGAAENVAPRAVAPLRVPREAWAAAAACGLLVLWAEFLAGWSVPSSPSARALAVIHREGRVLIGVGRRLDAAGGAQALPETRRVAPEIQSLGRRLEAPRIAPEDALALLRDAGRRLQAAQERVEHRINATVPGGSPGPGEPRPPAVPESGAQRLQRIDAVVREMEALTGQLRPGGSPVDRPELSQRLRALSRSLEQMGVPTSTREEVAQARRAASQGRLSAASGSLRSAMQDLRGLERMLGDEQQIGEARRDVQSSEQRIAQTGPLGADVPVTGRASPDAPPPTAGGPNPPSLGTDSENPPPPPGPNQGSLPGQGRGGTLGAPTPRLRGTHVQAHLGGNPGEGPSTMKEIVAPGRTGTSRLPAARPPEAVAHEIDRALSQDPLPPSYVTIIRRYFETLGGSP